MQRDSARHISGKCPVRISAGTQVLFRSSMFCSVSSCDVGTATSSTSLRNVIYSAFIIFVSASTTHGLTSPIKRTSLNILRTNQNRHCRRNWRIMDLRLSGSLHCLHRQGIARSLVSSPEDENYT